MNLGVGLFQEGGDYVGALGTAQGGGLGGSYAAARIFLSRLLGLVVFGGDSTACAVGCILAPLRGCVRVGIGGWNCAQGIAAFNSCGGSVLLRCGGPVEAAVSTW